ncbi:unnamed protein product [Schistosoma margrebowiei]|uniref:Uncharacterized protein n=1 Tax=Schistosoma margrebowiei TaxID=48269 RepID=A0A183M091_9TREM|nr:unnamed protein product [Schistosoma margrebowiei]
MYPYDRKQLDNLNFAADLALLSHTQQQMKEKTTSVAAPSAAVDLNVHKWKSKILRYNTVCNNLSSIIDEHGGYDIEVKARIGKARAAYLQLKNIWNSKQLSTNTKEQQPTVGENKPDLSGIRNQEEALEVDRTDNEKSTQLCHKASSHLESSRPKEKRMTKEHIMPRNRDKHEKNEEQLDRIRKERPF